MENKCGSAWKHDIDHYLLQAYLQLSKSTILTHIFIAKTLQDFGRFHSRFALLYVVMKQYHVSKLAFQTPASNTWCEQCLVTATALRLGKCVLRCLFVYCD